MTREEAINKVRQMSLPKETMQILEALAPELAESEDERMIREIKRYIKEQGDKPNGLPNGTVSISDMIAYLEKQKDYVSNNFDDVWDEEDCEEIITEGQKLTPRFKELLKEVCHAWYDRGAKLEKQKDASKAIEAVERIDKYIDENLANAHDMKDSNPDKKYYRGWDDALGEMARILQDVYSNEKQKESLRDFIDNFPYSAEQKEQKPVECIDFYDEFYKVYTGPKNILAYVNIFVKKLGYVPIDIHELSACVYYVIKHIEEDTKASQKEQKQEWSEEDESCWNLIWDILDGPFKASPDGYRKAAGWFIKNCPKGFKSLYPQYHGDITMTEAYKMGKEAGEASHWKPNEHQMTILKAVKEYVGKGSGYWGEGLGSLINDLEKL